MDYGLYDAVRAGFTRAVFVVRAEIETAVREHAEELLHGSLPFAFAHQTLEDGVNDRSVLAARVKPWGTAHAVLAARNEVRGAFAVCNADDLYGADAYRRLARHLTDTAAVRRHPIAIVGYRLAETLSKAGGVSRAVCEHDESGTLTAIREMKEIARVQGGISARSVGGATLRLQGSETVSMNLWGFTPAVFDAFERQFRGFIHASVQDPDAEFLIPTAVAEQVARGETRVAVLETESSWLGVTFRDDKEQATQQIRDLVDAEVYPRNLSDWFRSRT